ncbi:kinase subunit of RNA polymerase II carboxy-terminal domain kinase I [Mortierella alpina]|nr:kinase subunit of RNA polymerase II carboxy-terminal domain kinase I [Mortierella alpina]
MNQDQPRPDAEDTVMDQTIAGSGHGAGVAAAVQEAAAEDPTMLTTVSSTTTTTTKATTITASFTVPAVAKPLPTPALPFQSARASESLFTSSYNSFSRAAGRSGASAAAAASAAALQLQRELDMQHEVLGRKPQLAQDIVPKEPANPPTFRDYGATRDWRREQSRDRRDRSRERDRERDKDRHSRSRYDRSKERDHRGRHRDRYSRERSHERDHERDREYRSDRGYRNDYRYPGEHTGDRDYRGYRQDRHDRHDRHYRGSKDPEERQSQRDYTYDEAGSREGGRYEGAEGGRERSNSATQWKEGDDEGEAQSVRAPSVRAPEYRSRDYDQRGRSHGRDRGRYRSWDRSRGYDHDGDKYRQDWDDKDRAPRDRTLDAERAVPTDSTDQYPPPHRPSRDYSAGDPAQDSRAASGNSLAGDPAVPSGPAALRDSLVSGAAASAVAAREAFDPAVIGEKIQSSETQYPSVQPAAEATQYIEPLQQEGNPPVVKEQEPAASSAVPPSEPAAASEQPAARMPPPPPPLPPVMPTAFPQDSIVGSVLPNGHAPPPPPPLPPVAPPRYVPQNAAIPEPTAAPAEPAYPPPSGNAPPPPRRSTADDDYYGSQGAHGHYYRHSRSSRDYRDRESWHGPDTDHRYDSRRSHSRYYSQYPPEYDRHSRAPSPRNRDRYDYSHVENGGHRPSSSTDVGYVSGAHQEMHAPRSDVRQSPPLEHPAPPPTGYVMPYPPTDPAQQPLPSPTAAPMLKGEDLYERVGQVGEGTYGKVYKARNKQTGEYVALKRIRMETEKDGFPITAMREIKLLQSLSHRHVVSLKELMVSKGAVYMVFEYMDHDLTGILAHPNLKFRPEHVKCLMKQLLEGLGFLHHKGVLHRDIKGSNLLVNKLGELKLADFGLARLFQKKTKRDYTNRVITLWYRPPELILGATAYGPEVDMWSAGCIMVELFTRRPIFQGHNEIMQLDFIWKTMGTPQKETWPGVDQLPWYELIKHVNSENRSSRFREMFSKYMSPAALDLAEALLSLNPKKRPTAAESLANFAYFTEEEPAACLPEDLPKIEGDWHEYESKQRKKANARPKDQQHSTQQPQPSSRQPSDEIHSDRTEQDKQGRAPYPPVSKKHTLSGASKPSGGTTLVAPVGLVVMSGSSTLEPTVAAVEQAPDVVMSAPKSTEQEYVPPAVSPSYLPYSSSIAALPRPSDARAADYRGAPPQPPQPHLPPPPPPPLALSTYAEGSLPGQPHMMPHPHDAALNHGAAALGRYHNPSGAYDLSRVDQLAQPPGPAAISSQPMDAYVADAHRRSVSIDESRPTTIINAADTMTTPEIAIGTGTGTGIGTVSVNANMVAGEATIVEIGPETAKGTEVATAAANGTGIMIATEIGLGAIMNACESALEIGAMMMRTRTIETAFGNARGMEIEDAIESESVMESIVLVEVMTKTMTERGATIWIERCRIAG